ncbi:MAG TPA: Na/Pi symporter [bacterium]|nr:Na/Pi symporter [bacterium]
MISLLALLYVFLLSIAMMGAAFKMLGSGFSEALITSTASPVVGLLIGMLATAVIQSSSTTTSIVVGLVAAEALTVRGAVPIVMGANIGTTVTNTIVALTAVNRREEFKRSFAGATMHDFFNVMAVLVLFPLEQATRFLERAALYLSDRLVGTEAVEFANPVKNVTKPVAAGIIDAIGATGWAAPAVGITALGVAFLGLFVALYRLPRLLKSIFLSRAEGPFFRRLERGGFVGIAIGVFLTVLVQSSSITTSLLIPMIGAGLVPLEGAFAITLGANIGTTVTALLASTAGTHDSVAIALVHLLFNVTGIAIIYPFRPLRLIPIRLAERLAEFSMRSRMVPVLYLVFLFFLLPGLIILVQRLVRGS